MCFPKYRHALLVFSDQQGQDSIFLGDFFAKAQGDSRVHFSGDRKRADLGVIQDFDIGGLVQD